MVSFEELCGWFGGLDGVVVAFSGGVDSSVLAAAARSALGDGAVAVTVRSELQSGRDLSNARRIAAEIGIEHAILEMSILDLDEVRMNLATRCRLCKRAMAGGLLSFARSRGMEVVVDGTNASDREEDRPGMRSLLEAGIRMPLRELGISKEEVREMARDLGLSSADLPSRSCLAPRIEGPISPERLRRVEAAEELLPLGWKVSDREDWIEVLIPRGERLSEDAIRGLKRLGYGEVIPVED
ncbi:MAG TPA: ATP-dependent sacrificial sulfur transferase LarE [Methanothrix sp.]|nr:ATP-dependent sacrificial sulfur transferase LarE [Methanothrix sp.]